MPTFKNESGTYFLNALFFEQTVTGDKSTVVYTLKDEDYKGYPSLYRLYLEMGDVLEYDFANKYLAGWNHWLKLNECSWFKPYIERWRHELELKLRSEALARLVTDAKSTSRSAQTSNRFLLERGWDLEKKNTKGRPTKQMVRQATQKLVESQKQVENDFLRITETKTL